jgi:hypothetical protein
MSVNRNNTSLGLVIAFAALAAGKYFERPGQNELLQKFGDTTVKNHSTDQVDEAFEGAIEVIEVDASRVAVAPTLSTFGALGVGQEFEERGTIRESPLGLGARMRTQPHAPPRGHAKCNLGSFPGRRRPTGALSRGFRQFFGL